MVITPFELATLEGWKSPELIREGDFLLGVGTRYTANLSLPPFWSRVQRIQPVRYVQPVYTIPFLRDRLVVTQDSEVLVLRKTGRTRKNAAYVKFTHVEFQDFIRRTVVYSLAIANPMSPFSMTEYQLPHDLEKMIDWKIRRLRQSYLWSCWNSKGEEKVSEYPKDSWYYLSRDVFTYILEKALDINLSSDRNFEEFDLPKRYSPFLGQLQILCCYYGYGTEIIPQKRNEVLRIGKKTTYDYNTQYHRLAENSEKHISFHDGLVWSIQSGFRYALMRIHGIPFFIKSFVEGNT